MGKHSSKLGKAKRKLIKLSIEKSKTLALAGVAWLQCCPVTKSWSF